MSDEVTDPPLVAAAVARARQAGFPMSCQPAVRQLPRTDATVLSVEKDQHTAAIAARGDWPSFVELRHGDALDVLARDGAFDLIFADAPGGKWHGLDSTIAALGPHGLLVVDDMTPLPEWTDSHRAAQERVRRTLLTAPGLISVELAHGTGVILGARAA